MSHPKSRSVIWFAGISVVVLALVIVGIAVMDTSVYAAGDATYDVTFAHFSPFTTFPDPDDKLKRSKVNVSIDGVQVATEVAYLEQVSVGTLDTGPHEIEVEPVHWPEGIYKQTIDIPPASASSLIDPAIVLAYAGGAADIWFHVDVLAVEMAPPASGAKVRFVHYAPYSIDKDSEYTVCNLDGTTFNRMTMYNYGKISAYTDVPAGSYSVYLAGSHGTGCAGTHLTPNISITLGEGSVADFIAVGTDVKSDPFDNDLDVVTVTDQVSASASVLDEAVYLPMAIR